MGGMRCLKGILVSTFTQPFGGRSFVSSSDTSFDGISQESKLPSPSSTGSQPAGAMSGFSRGTVLLFFCERAASSAASPSASLPAASLLAASRLREAFDDALDLGAIDTRVTPVRAYRIIKKKNINTHTAVSGATRALLCLWHGVRVDERTVVGGCPLTRHRPQVRRVTHTPPPPVPRFDQPPIATSGWPMAYSMVRRKAVSERYAALRCLWHDHEVHDDERSNSR
eukprot:659300-Prymnesium_polylepis.1